MLLAHYGLGIGQQARLGVATAATVVAPGWWAARTLTPSASRLVQVGVAATAGIAPALAGWFVALHAGRAWAWFVPFAVAVAGLAATGGAGGPGPRRWARRARRNAARLPWSASVALLVSWLLVLRSLVVSVWAVTPADGRGAWYQDLSWHLSLTAEAMHRAPLNDPQSAADGRLSYHWFSNALGAHQALTTGVDLRHITVVWWFVPVMLAALALTYGFAVRLAGTATAGALAVLLLPLAPALPTLKSVMPSVNSALVWFSPSHMLAVPVGLLTLWVAFEVLVATRLSTALAVLGLVAALECAGSKVSLLPTFLGGMCVVGLLALRTRTGATRGQGPPRVGWRRPAVLAALTVAMIALTAPVFAGGGGGSHLSYGALAGQLPVWAHDSGSGWLHPATMTGLMLVLCVPFLAALPAAALWRRRQGRPEADARVALMLFTGSLAAALAAMFFLQHPSGSQAYFARGMAAPFAVFTAAGAVAAAQAVGARRGAACALAGLGAGWLWVSRPFFTAVHVPRPLWLWPLAAVAVVASVLLVRGVVAGRTWAGPASLVVLGLACAPGVHAAASNPLPALHNDRVSWKTAPLGDAEVSAADWIAAHNEEGALVATNVHCGRLRTTPACSADGFWVSALSQSPVLVGGWGYSTSARIHHGSGGRSYLRQPYRPADVWRLNERAFAAPTPEVLDALRARGVRYLFADARASRVSPQLARLAPPVFARGGVSVHDLAH